MDISHRKASQKIMLVDKNGNPVKGKNIEVKLINHKFLFGSGAFDFLPATAEDNFGNISFYQDKVNTNKAFYQERAEKWLKIFNYGTIPFYWGGYEPEEGNVLIESRMNAAKYLRKNGAQVKGHPLCWHTVCADWLMDYDNKTILDKQLKRIEREVTAFKGVINLWDVINEAVIMPVYDRYDNAVTRICNEYGRLTLIKEVFAAAHSANPDATLLINDFNLSDSYRKLIDECLEAGVPIKAIGLQTHQHQGYMGREKLENVLNRFSVFGLPMHFTENTLVSGEIMPAHIVDLNDYQVDEWPSTPEGEERQCREWREMYEILFSHPQVEAITGWDFADGAWLHAPSGLIREDNSEKPSYHELKKLVNEEWTTKDTIHTDDYGITTLNGFKGEYELTIDGTVVKFKLDMDDGETVRITV